MPTETEDILPATSTTTSSAVQDITSLVNTIRAATKIDWTSPSFIEGLAVKALAVVAIFHPGLNVGQWEPVILLGSTGIVGIESAIRGYLNHIKVTNALNAASKVIAQKSNLSS